MLRLIVLLPVPLLIAAAPPVASPDDPARGCINHGVDLATATAEPNGFRRLDQLPPVNEILTVIRSVDGCQKSVIVRYNVDGRSTSSH